MPKFEWDEAKNEKNKRKHNLSFENAQGVFDDENRLQYVMDRNGERRYITIGKVLKVIVTVVYTIRNFAFRLISARPAKKEERKQYLERSLTKQDDEYGKE